MIAGVNPKDFIIRLFHVHKRYGPRKVLENISLDIEKNEFVFITGPSGAGKSTLMKLLYLDQSVSEGQILVDGMNLSRISKKRIHLLRRKFGIIFQDFKLIPRRTVFENVALVLETQGLRSKLIRQRVLRSLNAVGIEERMNAYPPTLSGGEQQRVAIARAVVGNPAIILADEPTGSLDANAADHILHLLKNFHMHGGTVIVATHNRELIKKTNARTIYIDRGRILSM